MLAHMVGTDNSIFCLVFSEDAASPLLIAQFCPLPWSPLKIRSIALPGETQGNAQNTLTGLLNHSHGIMVLTDWGDLSAGRLAFPQLHFLRNLGITLKLFGFVSEVFGIG